MPKRAKPEPRWAVGQVLAGHEIVAQQRLTLHGCTAYLPVVTRLCRPAGRRKPEPVLIPLWPGYLFLDTRTVDDWGLVHDVRWILGFLGDEGRPAVLTDQAIDQVRGIEAEGAVEPVTAPLPVFVVGELVRVPDGPMTGFRGRVVGPDGKDRVWLDLDLFGQRRPVSFPSLTLRPECA